MEAIVMLTKPKICQIARIEQLSNLSNRSASNIIGCSHQTYGRYKTLIQANDLSWKQIEAMPEAELLSTLFPNRPYRASTKEEPDFEALVDFLATNKNQTIFNGWLNYTAEAGVNALGRTQFYHKFRVYRKEQKLSMKIDHNAGEIVYVDYAGQTIPYVNRKTDQKFKAQIFVSNFGKSKKQFMYATKGQTTADWIEAHVAMVEYYGGLTEIIVPDNPRAIVIDARKEKVLVANYESFGLHYGVVIMPARPRHPQDKGLVEHGVKFGENRILADMQKMTFFSLEEINAYLLTEVEKLNDLPLQKRKTTRNIDFEKYDKPMLRPLPDKPFQLIENVFKVKVPAEYGVTVDEHFYSVPYRFAHKTVEVHVMRNEIKVIHDMTIIATHTRNDEKGGMTRLPEHMHPDHRWFDDKELSFYWDWAEKIGSACQKLMSLQFTSAQKKSRVANVACRTIQSLYVPDKVSPEEFELACAFALKYHQTTPTHLKQIMSAKVYLEHKSPQLAPVMSHKNVRGSSAYVLKATGESS
jgi:transposase